MGKSWREDKYDRRDPKADKARRTAQRNDTAESFPGDAVEWPASISRIDRLPRGYIGENNFQRSR